MAFLKRRADPIGDEQDRGPYSRGLHLKIRLLFVLPLTGGIVKCGKEEPIEASPQFVPHRSEEPDEEPNTAVLVQRVRIRDLSCAVRAVRPTLLGGSAMVGLLRDALAPGQLKRQRVVNHNLVDFLLFVVEVVLPSRGDGLRMDSTMMGLRSGVGVGNFEQRLGDVGAVSETLFEARPMNPKSAGEGLVVECGTLGLRC